MPDKPLVTTRELAVALGLSVRTVQRLIKDGKITPAVSLPGRQRNQHRFDVEAVKAQLAQHDQG